MRTDCLYFNGYKPCGKSTTCTKTCLSYQPIRQNVLLIHLGALGAVVRSTALLKAIKRKFPFSSLTWITASPANKLLQAHPLIDRVLTTSAEDLMALKSIEFDVVLNVDKNLVATGIAKSVGCDFVFGFKSDVNGKIVPATAAAEELWKIGLSDELKFFVNKKSEIQLTHEALELGPYQRDDYFLPLSENEQTEVLRRKEEIKKFFGVTRPLIGFNTGCAATIPYKKLSIPFQRQLIQKIQEEHLGNVVLLGGPEDTERNNEIAKGLNVFQTSTTSGLRDGLVSVASCDLIVTGDSLGMHMSISQKIPTVAWFGPTCAHEIDLFDRGVAIQTKAQCSPCWKRDCKKDLMCYDQVSLDEILSAIQHLSCSEPTQSLELAL